MVSSPQHRAQEKTLYVDNLGRLGDAPIGARRSALMAALEPHRAAIVAALQAGHTPHAIARVLVEGPQGDDPAVRTWSRQSVQRAIARIRDDGRVSSAPLGASREERKSQARAHAAPPFEAQPKPAPAVATSPAPSRPATAFSNASRRP